MGKVAFYIRGDRSFSEIIDTHFLEKRCTEYSTAILGGIESRLWKA